MSDDVKHSGRSPFGPVTDMVPVTPNDETGFAEIGGAIYVENGGTLRFDSYLGDAPRTINVPDFFVFPMPVRRVYATGTTASGIHVIRTR